MSASGTSTKRCSNGWSRNILVAQIETGLYRRQGKALTNFAATLPAPDSDLAQQLLKDPYNFDFLTLSTEAQEKDLERGEDFKIDLLFYHLKLRCFVIIDLKMGQFKPADIGQMNFYLSAVDDLLRHPDDKPSIGLLLCKAKNRIVAEYALRDMTKPVGISEFHYLERLPDNLKGTLPTIEELEAELGKGSDRSLPQETEESEQ